MTYKSNFEPYVSIHPAPIRIAPSTNLVQVSRSHSSDSRDDAFYHESLDPIRSLYPFLSTPKQAPETNYFIGYNHSYWAEVYSTQPVEESHRSSLRRVSG